MSTAPILAPQDRSQDPDQRVILNGIDWWQFEAFLAIRGDSAGVRVTDRGGPEAAGCAEAMTIPK